MHSTRIFSKLIFAFGVGYAFIWALSILILIPYYSSAEFSYSSYVGLPFMAAIASELSEHFIPLPMFFIALTFLFPLISIFMLFSACTLRKISETASWIRFISQPLYITAIMLALTSFVPMVWILRELVVIEGSVVQNGLASAMPLLTSYIQAGQGFVNSIVMASKGWMATYGPVGLITAMIVSSIISPIPNEVILAFAGMIMSPISVAVFGAIGSTVGGVLCFYIARLGGRPLAEKFVKKSTIASMDRWFQRWGSWTIILGRLVPFIPFDAISYLSGLTKVRIERFAFLTFLGSVPRCLFYAYIGELIAEYNLPILIALFVTMLTVFLFFKIKKEKYI